MQACQVLELLSQRPGYRGNGCHVIAVHGAIPINFCCQQALDEAAIGRERPVSQHNIVAMMLACQHTTEQLHKNLAKDPQRMTMGGAAILFSGKAKGCLREQS